MNNNHVRHHYDSLNNNYLKCWGSLAKQDISRFELKLVDDVIREISRDKRIKILEIGPGPGRIAEVLLQYDTDYYAADLSPKMTGLIKSRFGKKVKQVVVADISKEDFYPNQKFDLIVAIRVIYYSEKWKEVISKLKNKLTPGGILIFCTLNEYSSAVLGRFLNKDKLEGHFTNYQELNKILNENKLKTITFKGYARLPDVLYDYCNFKFGALFLRITEKILSFILGQTLFMRMYYVVAEKGK